MYGGIMSRYDIRWDLDLMHMETTDLGFNRQKIVCSALKTALCTIVVKSLFIPELATVFYWCCGYIRLTDESTWRPCWQ